MVQVDCGEILLEAEGDFDVGEEVYVAVRPEEFELVDEISPPITGHNSVSGQVIRMVPTETHWRVEIDCAVHVVAAISRARVREMALEVGSKVRATFPARESHLIRRVGE